MRHRKKEGKSKKKKIQKHKILFIGIVSFLVILFFITLLGLRISFLINDDLTIKLTPLDKSIITTYDKANNLTFEFENYPEFSEDMRSNCDGKHWWEMRESTGCIDFNENNSLDRATIISASPLFMAEVMVVSENK